MKNFFSKVAKWVGIVVLVLSVAVGILSLEKKPEAITYGMSFNAFYAEELGLDWKETYDAILGELGVKHLRLAAHWPTVEGTRDEYDFSILDYQMKEAEEAGADVILVVGRRTPRWPECHVPTWAKELSWEEQKQEIRDIVSATVLRYKDYPNIKYWQVENEPYLGVFATEYCGKLDEDFLREEVEMVKSLDADTPILVTDSGNLGLWIKPYQLGDAFGTSVYLYLWNPTVGPFKSQIPAAFYRAKENLVQLLSENKPSLPIELSLEPWLTTAIVDASFEEQFARMDSEKFQEIIEFGKNTRFEEQYLWGAEWWYYLTKHGHYELWEAGKQVFSESASK